MLKIHLNENLSFLWSFFVVTFIVETETRSKSLSLCLSVCIRLFLSLSLWKGLIKIEIVSFLFDPGTHVDALEALGSGVAVRPVIAFKELLLPLPFCLLLLLFVSGHSPEKASLRA